MVGMRAASHCTEAVEGCNTDGSREIAVTAAAHGYAFDRRVMRRRKRHQFS